jgi:hypothetical protein
VANAAQIATGQHDDDELAFLSTLAPADSARSSGRHQDRDGGVSRHGDTVWHVSFFEDAFRRERISRTGICESARKRVCRISTLKSSHVPIRSADLWCCLHAGSSSALLNRCRRLAKDWRISTERRSHSCASPQSASCSENSAIRPEVPGPTVRRNARCLQSVPPTSPRDECPANPRV